MNERIKLLRKKLEMTQQEFASKIGVKRNTVAQYEIGRNEPIDSVINLICKEFNVDELWLRTGEGEMFLKQDTFSLDEYAKIHNLTDTEIEIIKNYIALPPETRKAIFSIFFPKDKQEDVHDDKPVNLGDEYPDDPDELCAPPDSGSDVG